MSRRSIGALCVWAFCACGHPPPAAGAPCDVSEWHFDLPQFQVDAWDVLFVIDNSPGMESVQTHLRDQLPKLFDALQTNMSASPYLVSAGDLHIGVITGDLGLNSAAEQPGCTAEGDAARLLQDPSCGDDEPEFIRYYQGFDDANQARAELACRGAVGTTGCPVQQPLAAAGRMLFGPNATQGGSDPSDIVRDAFLTRPGTRTRAGLIIVIITNQDDCSLADPNAPLTPDDAHALSQHCGAPQLLGSLQGYVDELQQLYYQPMPIVAVPELIVIAGIPEDLGGSWDRDSLQKVLDDPRMQSRLAPDGSLMPSCSTSHATATPPRRLVEAARDLNHSVAVLGSICADDLTTSVIKLFEMEWADLIGICVREDAPDGHGLIPCRVTWELPTVPLAWSPPAPTACSQRPNWLSEREPGEPRIGPHGGLLCDEHQVAVDGNQRPKSATDQGFFFSLDQPFCEEGGIAFTEAARPPPGVFVTVDCYDDVQHAPNPPINPLCGRDGTFIGMRCDALANKQLHGDELCAGGCTTPSGMFCHPEKLICVRGCTSDSDCPPFWSCDSGTSELAQSAGRPICVNLACN